MLNFGTFYTTTLEFGFLERIRIKLITEIRRSLKGKNFSEEIGIDIIFTCTELPDILVKGYRKKTKKFTFFRGLTESCRHPLAQQSDVILWLSG